MRQGKVDQYFQGDTQRIFTHQGKIYPRERLPPLQPVRGPAANEAPTGAEAEAEAGAGGESKRKMKKRSWSDAFAAPFGRVGLDPDIFVDHGHNIFLNFGNADRMYQYFAQKLITSRDLQREYRASLGLAGHPKVHAPPPSHAIRVKSFDVGAGRRASPSFPPLPPGRAL